MHQNNKTGTVQFPLKIQFQYEWESRGAAAIGLAVKFCFLRWRGARNLSRCKPCGWRHLDGRTESEKQECSLSCLSGTMMWKKDAKHLEWYQVDFHPAGATTLPDSWSQWASGLSESPPALSAAVLTRTASLQVWRLQNIGSILTHTSHVRANTSSSINVPWTNKASCPSANSELGKTI